MSGFPITFGTPSEIQLRNFYRLEELQKFIQMYLPLSIRILTVRLAMINLDQQRPYTFLQQAIEDACNTFDRCIIYWTNIFLDPNYVVCGGEVTVAIIHLKLATSRAERSFRCLQNLNVSRTLTSA